MNRNIIINYACLLLFINVILILSSCNSSETATVENKTPVATKDSSVVEINTNALDTALYNKLLQNLNNLDSQGSWQVNNVYPNPGAILPFNRIIAFYGTPLSKRMGILGELPEDEMLEKLRGEVRKWELADSSIPVKPALHYIATVAQATPLKEGKYILRMPFKQIDTILRMAKKIDAIVFLDLQVALSKIERELPMLEQYIKLPNVHIGIDPEFSMKTGRRPGTVVGSYNASDINYVIGYLQKIVKENNLPPKVLIVHRYTQPMVKNYKEIKPVPEVQVVMHMDGWGTRTRKKDSYYNYIYKEPVQFAGFKVFYKNDTKKVNEETVMQPEEILQLKPKPVYIQYQ